MTHAEFIRTYPEMKHLPEFIIGVGGRDVRLMDATLADLREYIALVERRIRRRGNAMQKNIRALRGGL
jgi:hypothetical protein